MGAGCLLCIAIGLLVHSLSGSWIYALAAVLITQFIAMYAQENGICRIVIEVLGFVFTLMFVLRFNGGIYFALFAGLIAAGVMHAVFTS